MTIVVYGSINTDIAVGVERFPVEGETVVGTSWTITGGGKGANQAVGCARLGATTRLVGKVGDDEFGQKRLKELQHFRVETGGVQKMTNTPTGTAVIEVNRGGQNRIVVVAGANAFNSPDDRAVLAQAMTGTGLLLLQLEIPLEAVRMAARLALQHGFKLILDPAPASTSPLPSDLYAATFVLTPNQTEAAHLVGFELDDRASIERAAQILLKRGPKRVIIKLGARGLYWADSRGDSGFVEAFATRVVDTVAAGDAFNAGLAVALSEGRIWPEALRWGLATAALSVSQPGAQSSMPTRSAVEALTT